MSCLIKKRGMMIVVFVGPVMQMRCDPCPIICHDNLDLSEPLSICRDDTDSEIPLKVIPTHFFHFTEMFFP